jgi:hypothetical protein
MSVQVKSPAESDWRSAFIARRFIDDCTQFLNSKWTERAAQPAWEAWILLAPDYHVVFMLPTRIEDIAYSEQGSQLGIGSV